MTGIFLNLLEVNIAMSVVILLLCLFAEKLRKRYGAGWMKTVWILTAIRLLIPYNFTLNAVEMPVINIPVIEIDSDITENTKITSDLTINNKMQNNVMGNEPFGLPVINTNDHMLPQNTELMVKPVEQKASDEAALSQADIAPKMNPAKQPPLSLAKIVSEIWIAGTVIFMLYFLTGYLLFYGKCRRSLRPVKDKELERRILKIEKKRTGKSNIPVYQSRRISSPMLVGILRPRLEIPAFKKQWNETELELVIGHELCHYEKKDIFLKLLMTAAGCMNWFNPVVYFMKRQFFYDMELSCDECVLQGRDPKEREAYARIMLVFAGKKNKTLYFSAGFGGNKSKMKKRIDHMLDAGMKKKGILSIVVTGVVILAVSTIVSCGYKPEVTDQDEISDQSDSVTNTFDEGAAQEEMGTEDSDQQEKQEFDYNHEYNEMIRVYGDDIYLSREDGIYCIKGGNGEEELIFANDYGLRRGMEIYQDSIYFCGSAVRGENTAATIYRLYLDTGRVEDALAVFSGIYDALYGISVYEDQLYVSNGYQVIGFDLNEKGEIISQLDETADDFLYKEYNDYMELELKKWNTGDDQDEYWRLVEEQEDKYRAMTDVAACKKMLQAKQVVSKYKDELYRSIYLESEEGTYEYLCDAVGFPLIVTPTGLYYAAYENGEIWYADFETKNLSAFYEQGSEWGEVILLNYDADYVYLLKKRRIGYDMENMTVSETYLIRVNRLSGQAEKVYQLEGEESAYGLNKWYRHCGVYEGRMYFDDRESISLDPEVNGMQRVNSGELSEDAKKIVEAVEAFTAEYFGEAENYSEQIASIQGLPEGEVAEGVTCYINYVYKGHEDEDWKNLSIEVLKTQEGWEVKGYEPEME
ncbi:MAG: hypothetical protein HDR71_04815 [Lachnospiraceae bacterium]|nr:hypothetical protein [Lachnospiraceae bacterium]